MTILTMNYRRVFSFFVLANSIPNLYGKKCISASTTSLCLLSFNDVIKWKWKIGQKKKHTQGSESDFLSTLETHGQVVSTILTFLSFSTSISSTAAPKAGNITTSPGLTASNLFLFPSSKGMLCTPISSNRCKHTRIFQRVTKWYL